jgi:hypothetical protein
MSSESSEELGNDIFYWTEWSELQDNGTLVIKTSGYEDGAHWTGYAEIETTSSDYRFWRWVASGRHRRKGLKSKAEVDVLKAAYERPVSRPWWRFW